MVAQEYVNVKDHINKTDQTISDLIHSAMEIRDLLGICKYWNSQLDQHAGLVKAPNIITFIINLIKKIGIDKTIKIMNKNGRNTILNLRSLIYFVNFHCFMSRWCGWNNLVQWWEINGSHVSDWWHVENEVEKQRHWSLLSMPKDNIV